MYAESQSNKPYNLKKEAIKGGITGLTSSVLALGLGLAFKPTIRGDTLETILVVTTVASIVTGVTAAGFYARGYVRNLFS